MDLTRKQRAIKYICFCALILLAELFQSTAGLLPEIFGARCFILLPALIILAVTEEESTAAFLGLFAGALWDISSGVHMGFNCIFLAVICFLLSALVNHILRDTFAVNMLMCAIVIVLYCLLYWLMFIVIKGIDGGAVKIFSFYLPSALYTAAVTPIIYIIYKPIKKKFKATPHKER